MLTIRKYNTKTGLVIRKESERRVWIDIVKTAAAGAILSACSYCAVYLFFLIF